MSLNSTVTQITQNELAYLPAIQAGVRAAETTGADGKSKEQAVINGVLALAQTTATSAPQPSVQGISALIFLTVSIFNALGFFKKKTPVAAAP
jgi:hypothetical protein